MEVSVLGLGGGGPSKLGTRTGMTADESRAVVHAALDGGINIFDSSESYGTETLLGSALKDVRREDVIVCTKLHGGIDGRAKNLQEVEATLDQSLANLQTDYIDVYMMHAVGAIRYDAIAVPLFPSLQKMKEKGKIRAIGITECFNADRGHAMLQRALSDDWYDVIMVGFSLLNPSARDRVLRRAREQNVGVLDMFAVRRALRDVDALEAYLDRCIEAEELDDSARGLVQVVESCLDRGECATLSEMAYRYCLHEDGVGCVLSGTGSLDHLRENLATARKGPLSQRVLDELAATTGDWDHLSAQ
jgi:aryl-alcohol dehydrogenase-like predicted oxidoreductase